PNCGINWVTSGASAIKRLFRNRRRMLCTSFAIAATALGLSLIRGWARASPAVLTQYRDAAGVLATYEPNGSVGASHPFFRPIGVNGRACVSCHQPSDGWTITPAHIEERFKKSHGEDPLFRLVDGATCPSNDVSTPAARRRAYKLLLTKGLIRMPI